MFDFSMGEIALFIAVALIFIGPKDLPVVLRGLAKALKFMRKLAHEFQQHLDEMLKEADLSDAHKELQNLKNFSLRKQVTRLIDPKDTLNQSFEDSLEERKIPDSPYDGLPRAPAPPPPPSSPILEGQMPHNARIAEKKEALERAPSILPPVTAMRLIEESPHWQRPDFLPPEVALHYGKRVLIVKNMDKEAS